MGIKVKATTTFTFSNFEIQKAKTDWDVPTAKGREIAIALAKKASEGISPESYSYQTELIKDEPAE